VCVAGIHTVLAGAKHDLLARVHETSESQCIAFWNRFDKVTSLENTCRLKYRMNAWACANTLFNVLGMRVANNSSKRASICRAT
jgi:hypothetical protein